MHITPNNVHQAIHKLLVYRKNSRGAAEPRVRSRERISANAGAGRQSKSGINGVYSPKSLINKLLAIKLGIIGENKYI